VSPAFAEDPLRVLRVARFIARYHHLGFRVADETLALMRTIVRRGEIQDLTPERAWQEIERALMERSPSRFFDLLHRCGALGVLMPELEQRYHSGCQGRALDALEHCSQSQAEAPVRFAVLSYFFNSPATSDTIDPSAKDPSERCERLKAPGAFKEAAQLLNRYADTALELQQLNANKRLELFEELDLLRRPKRQSPFLQGCRALAGHSDPEAPCPAEHILNQVRLAVESVTPLQLVNEGYKGKALGLELRERRLKAVQELSGPS
jgi:tRNA nucleotidyltransferase (CCA-adding enzyme)